jgi:hypothetical protein
MSAWLTASSFASYPPQGRQFAASHLSTLREIPLALLPVFLVDIKVYDWKFPIEQQEIAKRLEFVNANLASLDQFRTIKVPAALDTPGSVDDPQRFLAEITAYLWSSLQMDAYRGAANRFMELYSAANRPKRPAISRLVMLCVGRDAQLPEYPLFHKLRGFGQLRTNVHAEGAADAFLDVLRRRSASAPELYAHWYVDGGSPLIGVPTTGVSQIMYPALAPLNGQILARMKSCIEAGTGPEELQRELAEISEHAPLASNSVVDLVLQHFCVSLLTEGSGTQIFSTSFVQWATREVLRRAQPVTLFARFAPRQRERSFNAMVAEEAGSADLDPAGSLIDADMAAYYAYLELMRLSDAENAAFLVWLENRSQAFVAGRGIPVNTVSDSPISMAELLSGIERPI